MNCAGPCERPLLPREHHGPAPLGMVKLDARGRCTCCYRHDQRRGRLPRVLKPRADVIEDTAIYAGRGLSRAEVAALLGLKPDSLYQAHRRAGVPCPV